MKNIKRLLVSAFLLMLIIAQAGCDQESAAGNSVTEPVTGDNYFLDTICTISVYAIKDSNGNEVQAMDAEEAAEAAIDEAFDLCAELDKILSRTRAESDIGRVNSAGGEWTEVSDYTIDLVKSGIEYSELSDGQFDITIGGVTEQWDFHADPEDATLPDADELAEAVKHVDYNNIEIDGNKLRLKDPETKIDLGGIAKGYVGDRMTESLEAAGVTSGIINLGGNVICIGGKYTGNDEEGVTDFVVGVEAPFSDRTEIVGKVNVRDKTLVTSGVYERKIEVDGKLYHHILSTETGWSADTDLDAVTLVGDKGKSMDLDALSTICLIKGSKAAKQLIEETDGVEAVFLLNDGTTDQTSGMEFEAENNAKEDRALPEEEKQDG